MTVEKKEIDWENLGFDYIKTDFRYVARFKDGKWGEGKLVEDPRISIHEASTCLHYGQQCFEGLKAYTTPEGRIVLFRPDQNAKRLNRSARRLVMAEVPEDMFIDAVEKTVQANLAWVPPYGSGASLYIRPYLIGVGENIAVKPAPEYVFSIFVMPVGSYFKGGMAPINFMVCEEYDRAAPRGTGSYKVGGNYAASLEPNAKAKASGFADMLYLDAKTHSFIDEVGAANFFGITPDNQFVTPKSPSVLPSITKYSLIHIAENMLGMTVQERDIPVASLDQFAEAGACGTAAVISPIGGISYRGKLLTFNGDGKEVGPVIKKLYEILTGIQVGEIEAPEGWVHEVC